MLSGLPPGTSLAQLKAELCAALDLPPPGAPAATASGATATPTASAGSVAVAAQLASSTASTSSTCTAASGSTAASSSAAKWSLCFHPFGTDNQLLADAADLVQAMAAATGRSLQWKDSPLDAAPVRPLVAPSGAAGDRVATQRASWSTALRAGNLLGALRPPSGAVEPRYSFFISYYREEAGCIARYLQACLRLPPPPLATLLPSQALHAHCVPAPPPICAGGTAATA